MKHTLPWRVAASLPIGVLAVWIALSAPPADETARFASASATGAAPYESAYPAPAVDPAAPPQEPAPTF